MEQSLFYVFAAIALGSSLAMVVQRNPVAAAMNLVLTMFSLAALFVLLQAHFLAVIQLLVYAGAVMVLFLFVIMFLNLTEDQMMPGRRSILHVAGIALAIFALFQLRGLIDRTPPAPPKAVDAAFGTTKAIGKLLFSDYLLPFEITSVLILAAIVGAVVLAKRRLD
jgi:NADH-quinone oxidoreductase subunit J